MKRSFFQAAVASILLYGCTTWTLTKRLEKKLDGSYTRMLRAILNKSWRQHPTRHLTPITKTIQVRQTRHAGHCWRSRDELISDVLLWTPTHGRAKAGRSARTYIQQLCEDTGCCPVYFISQVGRVFANGPGDLGSILCRVIPKTLKRLLNTSLLNTQQYKVRIKGKVEKFKERSSVLPYTSVQ